jgi:hypothetical protein
MLVKPATSRRLFAQPEAARATSATPVSGQIPISASGGPHPRARAERAGRGVEREGGRGGQAGDTAEEMNREQDAVATVAVADDGDEGAANALGTMRAKSTSPTTLAPSAS